MEGHWNTLSDSNTWLPAYKDRTLEAVAVTGPHSFTHALIWALGRLKDKELFSTDELQNHIRLWPGFPKSQSPLLLQRFLPPGNHITLSPLPEGCVEQPTVAS
jgi:hypothetical protein